jgi:hypothetical protein
MLISTNSWKIRFLVRTYKFLSRLLKDKGKKTTSDGTKIPGDDTKAPPESGKVWPAEEGVLHLELTEKHSARMRKTARAQLDRIKENLDSVFRYLVRALLEPGFRTPVMPDNHVAGESNYYYVMTSLWYMARNSHEWDTNWKGAIGDWKEPGLLFNSDRLPSDNWTFEASDRDKVSLLQWFHHGSILGLCQSGILPKGWEEKGFEEKVSRLAKEAKISAAAKLSSREAYSADDEIIDRLSFLSDELGFEPRGYGQTGTVASLCSKRVKQRDTTRDLNPGWLKHGEGGSTSGPWEIHALCHHSRLVVSSLEIKDSPDSRSQEHSKEEIESFKQKIYHFRNAEGTLIPCWERAHAKARKGWLRSEATAVLASTLLMINERDMKDKLTTVNSIDGKSAPDTSAVPDNLLSVQQNALREHLYMETLMKEEITVLEKFTGEAGRMPPIQWTTFAPPRRYHPHSFFDSLEDTPELYRPPKITEGSIPASLRNWATSPEEMKTEFKYENLETFLTNFGVFDITATGPDEDDEGYTWQPVFYKFDVSDSKNLKKLEKLAKFIEDGKKLETLRKGEKDLEQLLKKLFEERNRDEKRKQQILDLDERLQREGDLKELKEEREKLLKQEDELDELKEQRITKLKNLLGEDGGIRDLAKKRQDEEIELKKEAKKRKLERDSEREAKESRLGEHTKNSTPKEHLEEPDSFDMEINEVENLTKRKEALLWALYDSVSHVANVFAKLFADAFC